MLTRATLWGWRRSIKCPVIRADGSRSWHEKAKPKRLAESDDYLRVAKKAKFSTRGETVE
eukprot:6030933-Prymnesium_polylepis.1